jgi:hypothetical protein
MESSRGREMRGDACGINIFSTTNSILAAAFSVDESIRNIFICLQTFRQ